jgi:hypothetical protein
MSFFGGGDFWKGLAGAVGAGAGGMADAFTDIQERQRLEEVARLEAAYRAQMVGFEERRTGLAESADIRAADAVARGIQEGGEAEIADARARYEEAKIQGRNPRINFGGSEGNWIESPEVQHETDAAGNPIMPGFGAPTDTINWGAVNPQVSMAQWGEGAGDAAGSYYNPDTDVRLDELRASQGITNETAAENRRLDEESRLNTGRALADYETELDTDAATASTYIDQFKGPEGAPDLETLKAFLVEEFQMTPEEAHTAAMAANADRLKNAFTMTQLETRLNAGGTGGSAASIDMALNRVYGDQAAGVNVDPNVVAGLENIAEGPGIVGAGGTGQPPTPTAGIYDPRIAKFKTAARLRELAEAGQITAEQFAAAMEELERTGKVRGGHIYDLEGIGGI